MFLHLTCETTFVNKFTQDAVGQRRNHRENIIFLIHRLRRVFRRPILGNFLVILVPTLSDRYAAVVGIVFSDAGKQRAISRFISLATVFDALSKKDPSWAENMKYVKSKYIHRPSAWTVPLEAESGSSSSPKFQLDQVSSPNYWAKYP